MRATLQKAALKALFHRNDGVDMRTTAGKRKQALVEAYLGMLDREPSAADLAIIAAAASQRLELEAIERQALKGAPLPRSYCTLSRMLERNLERIRSRPVMQQAKHVADGNAPEHVPEQVKHYVPEQANAASR